MLGLVHAGQAFYQLSCISDPTSKPNTQGMVLVSTGYVLSCQSIWDQKKGTVLDQVWVERCSVGIFSPGATFA